MKKIKEKIMKKKQGKKKGKLHTTAKAQLRDRGLCQQ